MTKKEATNKIPITVNHPVLAFSLNKIISFLSLILFNFKTSLQYLTIKFLFSPYMDLKYQCGYNTVRKGQLNEEKSIEDDLSAPILPIISHM